MFSFSFQPGSTPTHAASCSPMTPGACSRPQPTVPPIKYYSPPSPFPYALPLTLAIAALLFALLGKGYYADLFRAKIESVFGKYMVAGATIFMVITVSSIRSLRSFRLLYSLHLRRVVPDGIDRSRLGPPLRIMFRNVESGGMMVS